MLRSLNSTDRGFIFGHQHTNLRGQNWSPFQDPKPVTYSDANETVGFPALAAYNLELVTSGGEDLTPFTAGAASLGAVVALHWEASNPVTGKSDKDLSGDPIVEIMPGGSANTVWRGWLDQVANLSRALATQPGRYGGQVIFRPFHEMTGAWFWWGSAAATPAQYIAAWQYTREYLVTTRGVDNLLFAWSPSTPSDHAGWRNLYPGDGSVDIVCSDRYDKCDGTYAASLAADCRAVVDFADAHGKVAALCETGVRGGSENTQDAGWWDQTFLPAVLGDATCARGVTYVQTWTNAPDAYWVPLPGQLTAASFARMGAHEKVYFAGEVPPVAAASVGAAGVAAGGTLARLPELPELGTREVSISGISSGAERPARVELAISCSRAPSLLTRR